jgi:uncharacterized protein (TIGR04255 family)
VTDLVSTPFGDDSVVEIPLDKGPLVQVIAQVQFPLEPAIAIATTPAFLGFHSAVKNRYNIKDTYPQIQPRQEVGTLTVRDGYAPIPDNVLWEFERPRTSWKVSLSPEFVAVYGPAYNNSQEYLTELEAILNEVSEYFAPSACRRIGLRHVNRIGMNQPFEVSGKYVRPELHGFLDVQLPPSASLRYSLTETEFQLARNTRILAKWGLVPGGSIVDPNIEVADTQHFLLDIDVFSIESHEFDVEWILERMHDYTQSSYRFFRWSLTEEGLETYRGNQYGN